MIHTHLSRLIRRASHLGGPLSRLRAADRQDGAERYRHEIDYLRRILSGGMCFVDVGVGGGELALTAAAQLPRGRVLALDPDPAARLELQRNVELWQLGSVELVEDATVESIGQLDALFADRGLERLDILRIAVEGAQLDILRGAEHTVRRCRPTLIVQVGGVAGQRGTATVSPLLDALEALGYRTHAFQARHAHGTGELTRERIAQRAQQSAFHLLCKPATRPAI